MAESAIAEIAPGIPGIDLTGGERSILVPNPLRPQRDIRSLRLAELQIDPEVQRHKLDMRWVLDLTKRWNPLHAGVLVVSARPNGVNAVLDGWHRMATMRLLGIEQWDCETFWGLGEGEEADVFLGHNDQRGVHTHDMFRLRLRRGDPHAHAVVRILRHHGTRVAYSTADGYACVALLERIHQLQLLGATVGLIEQCWPGEPDARRTIVVEGVALFLRNYAEDKNYREQRALMQFSLPPPALGLPLLLRRARTDAQSTREPAYFEFADLLRSRYNEGLRNRLPELRLIRGRSAA